MIARILNWYWAGLKQMPAFSAGYIIGCLATATFITLPKLAYATLAMVP